MKTQIRLFNVSLSTPRNTRPCAAKCENCDSDWVPCQVNFETFFKLFLFRSSNGLFLLFFERKSFEIRWFDLAFSLVFPMKSAFFHCCSKRGDSSKTVVQKIEKSMNLQQKKRPKRDPKRWLKKRCVPGGARGSMHDPPPPP